MRASDYRWWLFGALLCLQATLSLLLPRHWSEEHSLGSPPDDRVVRVLGLNETRSLGYGMMLHLQSFDAQAGQSIQLRSLDMISVVRWLHAAMRLAPENGYPLFLASRIYPEMAPPPERREMLEFVHRYFLDDPHARWPWLAHAAYLARHSLKDNALALRFARSLRTHATGASVPRWVREIEIYVLEAGSEFEAAQFLLAGLLASGQITDPRDLEVMTNRLAELREQSRNNPVAEDKKGLSADRRQP